MKRDPLLWLAASACLLIACEPAPLGDEGALYEGAVALPDCRPNNDGVIERAEMPFVPGAVARYRVADGEVAVDSRGVGDDEGNLVWDLSLPDPKTEPLAKIAAEELKGQWYADSFPGLSLVGPLAADGSLYGPLSVDDEGVHIHGAASRDPEPPEGRTLLVYDEPITLYPFPLSLGARQISESRAENATLLGIPVALIDRYDVEVTGRGTVILPDLILENTLRVTLRLERTLVAGDARQVTHVFVHECLGEVARLVSGTVPLDEELPDELDTAAQVWRLSL